MAKTIWKVVTSYDFTGGMMLGLAVVELVRESWWMSALAFSLFAVNLAFAVAAERNRAAGVAK